MIVKCNKIISPLSAEEDLGTKSPWLTQHKKYVVLALEVSLRDGIEILIQTDEYNEPRFTSIHGFEVVSDKIPSTWVTETINYYNFVYYTMLPKPWIYDSFYEELSDEKPKAVELFIQEAEKIYLEEGYTFNW